MDARLYTSSLCPFAQRVTIAFFEHNLIDSIVCTDDLGPITGVQLYNIQLHTQRPEWFLKINPKKQVPALQLKTGVLVESELITRYVLMVLKSPLVDLNPMETYNASYFCEKFKSFPGAWHALMKTSEEDMEENTLNFFDVIRVINDTLPKEGDWALGDKFSIADVLCAPFIMRLPALNHFHSITIPKISEFSRVNKWIDACSSRKSIAETTLPYDEMIAAYKRMIN